MVNMEDRIIAWGGNVLGWVGALFVANSDSIETGVRIFSLASASFASICTGVYFLRKQFKKGG